jgi:predicted lipid-binding transport protein (Tim44 family)
MPDVPDRPAAPRPPQQAGGCLIAAGLIIGPIVGLAFGQVSIGLIAGFAVGVVAAVVMALRDRK